MPHFTTNQNTCWGKRFHNRAKNLRTHYWVFTEISPKFEFYFCPRKTRAQKLNQQSSVALFEECRKYPIKLKQTTSSASKYVLKRLKVLKPVADEVSVRRSGLKAFMSFGWRAPREVSYTPTSFTVPNSLINNKNRRVCLGRWW